jgi:hypothetical protein
LSKATTASRRSSWSRRRSPNAEALFFRVPFYFAWGCFRDFVFGPS